MSNGKKIKVLAYCDSPSVATGFATVSRNIFEALYKTGRYDVDCLGINYFGDPHNFPYRIWPVFTNEQRDPYGRKKICGMIPSMDFDLLFFLQDTFILDFIPELLPHLKSKGKKFKAVTYFPVDGEPKTSWIKNVSTCDYKVAYCEFGKREALKAYPEVGDLHIIPHGANTKDFKPMSKKIVDEFRGKYFGKHADKFIITNLNRNQPRKDIPRSIAAFKKFREVVPNSIMNMHMARQDQGWDLVEVCKAYGLSIKDDVIFPDNFGPNQGYPLNIVNLIYNASDVVVSTSTGEGAGLCLHPDTNIYTQEGVKKIKNVKVTDKVLSHDGSFNNVVGVMTKNHSGDLYKITSWLSNIPISSSPEHGFMVLGNDGTAVWKKAADLSVGDNLVFPNRFEGDASYDFDILDFINDDLNVRQKSNLVFKDGSFGIQSNFKGPENLIPQKIKITEDLCRLFGLYIAEGSISSSKNDSVTFAFHKNEVEHIDFVKNTMKSVFNLDCHYKNSDKRVGYNGMSITFYSSILSILFSKLFGVGARNKKIPKEFIYLKDVFIKQLLLGVFIGDGSYSNTTFELSFSTTSTDVAYSLRMFMAKLGVLSSVRTSRVEYKVNVSGISKENLLKMFSIKFPDLDRKKANERAYTSGYFLVFPIKKIEIEKYVGKLVDIQVENTNTFVAENVVVHNSWLESMATKTPVLMPNNTALTEFITEDRGYLIDSGTNNNLFTVLPRDNEVIRPLCDVDDMVKKLVHIYKNPEEAKKKAENAYNWIVTKMDWQGPIAKQWVDLFDRAYEDLQKKDTEVIKDEKNLHPEVF